VAAPVNLIGRGQSENSERDIPRAYNGDLGPSPQRGSWQTPLVERVLVFVHPIEAANLLYSQYFILLVNRETMRAVQTLHRANDNL